MIFETRSLYDRFRRAGGDRPRAGATEAPLLEDEGLGIAVRRIPFEASGLAHLRPEDRAIEENARFEVPVFEPLLRRADVDSRAPPTPHERLVVVLHGLNETLYNKLFPWAASLCARLGRPVALFPMALHVTRRPHAWIDLGRELYATRAALPDNASASPFNAVLSARLEAAPDRFVRAGLATCDDLAALAASAHAGDWPGCAAGTRVDFVGYSAGGYAALCLLAGERGDAPSLSSSRVCLLASGADGAGIDTESVLILDRRASRALTASLAAGDGARGLADRYAEARAFDALYAGRGADIVRKLGTRVQVFTLENDRVILAARIAHNLAPLATTTVSAGLHEYPFSLTEALPTEALSAHGRRLLAAIARASDVAPPLHTAFATFIEGVAQHLEAP